MTVSIDEVDIDLAMAVGLYALTDAPAREVADRTGVAFRRLREAIEDAELAEPTGADPNPDVTTTIDRLFEDAA